MDRDKYCFILNKINVNTVNNNSGIFIGFNTAPYWQATFKQNLGFGTVGDGCVIGNTQIVIDNDFIDAPVDNRAQSLTRDLYDFDPVVEPNEQELPITLIKFDQINVNALNRNATVAIGENQQSHWETFNKQNYGSGFHSGENVLGKNMNLIQDNDFIDAPITEQSVNNTLQYSRDAEEEQA